MDDCDEIITKLRETVNAHSKAIKQMAELMRKLSARVKYLEGGRLDKMMRDDQRERESNFMKGLIDELGRKK